MVDGDIVTTVFLVTRTKGRPLNSHGLTVRYTVLGLFSRSHGQIPSLEWN